MRTTHLLGHLPWIVLLAACSKGESEPRAAGTPGVLRGTIDIAPELADRVASTDTVFVAARQGAGGGPPLAVARLPLSGFPIAFELTADNAMVAGAGAFEGAVALTVRIDKDGDAMTRTAGDLVGSVPAAQIGGPPVRVVIDQVLP